MRKTFGAILTTLGIAAIVFAGVAFLKNGESLWGIPIGKWESVVPFAIGIIFFTAGIGMINNAPVSDKTKDKKEKDEHRY